MLREIVEEINEGMIDKAISWAINNINFIQKLYIKNQKKYGNRTIKSNKLKYIDTDKDIDYLDIEGTSGKRYLGIVVPGISEPTSEEIFAMIDLNRVSFQISELPELEKNGIQIFIIKTMRKA